MFQDFLKNMTSIEDEFFEIDKQNNLADIVLNFEKPSDIFDINYGSKLPVLSDDFLDWINSAFRIIPHKYKIRLEVCFEDMEGYDAAELEVIFAKNILLEYRSQVSARKKEKHLAWSLIGAGTLLLLATIFLSVFWTNDGIYREIIMYVLDIAATVSYWEALTILIVKRKEDFGNRKDLISRFAAISFHEADKPAAPLAR